jgi:hypothetical protein
MLEKFVQAAIITFLLHLLAGLSTSTTIPNKIVFPIGTMSSAPIVTTEVDNL